MSVYGQFGQNLNYSGLTAQGVTQFRSITIPQPRPIMRDAAEAALQELEAERIAASGQRDSLNDLKTCLTSIGSRALEFTPAQRKAIHAAVTTIIGPAKP